MRAALCVFAAMALSARAATEALTAASLVITEQEWGALAAGEPCGICRRRSAIYFAPPSQRRLSRISLLSVGLANVKESSLSVLCS